MLVMGAINWPGRPIPEKWEGPTLADCKVYRPVEIQGKLTWDWIRMFERDVIHLARQLPGAVVQDDEYELGARLVIPLDNDARR